MTRRTYTVALCEGDSTVRRIESQLREMFMATPARPGQP